MKIISILLALTFAAVAHATPRFSFERDFSRSTTDDLQSVLPDGHGGFMYLVIRPYLSLKTDLGTLWTYHGEGMSYPYVLHVDDQRIIVQGDNFQIYALDLTTGRLLWEVANPNRTNMSGLPHITGHLLGVRDGRDLSKVRYYDLKTGLLTRVETIRPQSRYRDLVTNDGTWILVSALIDHGDTTELQIEARHGERVLWVQSLPREYLHSNLTVFTQVNDTTLLLGYENGDIIEDSILVDLSTGRLTRFRPTANVAYWDDEVFLGSRDTIEAYDRNTLKPIWRSKNI